MKYLWLSLVIIGCACEQSSAQHYLPEYRSEIDLFEIRQKVKQIEVECLNGETHTGSAVLIGSRYGDTYWATAKHVLPNHHCFGTIAGNYATLAIAHDDVDISVVRVPDIESPLETRASPNTAIGMDIWAAGYPVQLLTGRTRYTVTRGVLAAKLKPSTWRITSSIWFGSSGGGVFDANGNLVCISTSVLVGPFGSPIEGEFYCTPAEYVYEMIL